MSVSQSGDRLYAVTVDLRGSNAGPLFESVRHLLDGSRHTPIYLRELCAEHYDISLEQVGQMVPISREQFDAEQDQWQEEAQDG